MSSTGDDSSIVWLGPDDIEPSGPILEVQCSEVQYLQVVGAWRAARHRNVCHLASHSLSYTDLRIHLRARGKSPAGNRDVLIERLIASLVQVSGNGSPHSGLPSHRAPRWCTPPLLWRAWRAAGTP